MEDQIIATLNAKGYQGTLEAPFPRDAGTWTLVAAPASGQLTKSLNGVSIRTGVRLTATSAEEMLAKVERLSQAP